MKKTNKEYPWNKYNECPKNCGWWQSGYCPAYEMWNHDGKLEVYPSKDAPEECLRECRKTA